MEICQDVFLFLHDLFPSPDARRRMTFCNPGFIYLKTCPFLVMTDAHLLLNFLFLLITILNYYSYLP